MSRDVSHLIDDNDNYSNVNATAKFDIIVRNSGKTAGTIKGMRASDTVKALKELIESEIYDNSKKVQLAGMGQLEKPLSFYKFPKASKRANKVMISFKARGGAAPAVKFERNINFSEFPHLKRSDKPDCILGDRVDGENYAEMPCGCAISAESMYSWIKSIFNKTTSSYIVKCPHHKVEWDWDLCTEVANMNDDEYDKWDAKRNERHLDNYRACPHCKCLCERQEDVMIMRVRCTNCSGSDWCWECGQRWNHSGLLICGNKNCELVEEVTETLQTCDDITLEYINAKCPSVRACPRCWTLMTWTAACKHMHCKGCDKKFCFMCLGLQGSDGKWPCNSHSYKCNMAPRQNFMK